MQGRELQLWGTPFDDARGFVRLKARAPYPYQTHLSLALPEIRPLLPTGAVSQGLSGALSGTARRRGHAQGVRRLAQGDGEDRAAPALAGRLLRCERRADLPRLRARPPRARALLVPGAEHRAAPRRRLRARGARPEAPRHPRHAAARVVRAAARAHLGEARAHRLGPGEARRPAALGERRAARRAALGEGRAGELPRGLGAARVLGGAGAAPGPARGAQRRPGRGARRPRAAEVQAEVDRARAPARRGDVPGDRRAAAHHQRRAAPHRQAGRARGSRARST